MDKELLLDMFYAAPEIWYAVAIVVVILATTSAMLYYNVLKLKQKNYFSQRNKDRYAETINASKDGYYIFIYPDDKVNDPRTNTVEYCSRRLAVILCLNEGISAEFDTVLRNFYRDDAEKISKYVSLLKSDGVPFEDKFILKSGKTVNLSGARISGADGSVYGDIIWFRDISGDANYVDSLLREQKNLFTRINNLKDMIDNIPYPIWLRDNSLSLIASNRKYNEFIDGLAKNSADNEEAGEENLLKNLSAKAQENNRPQHCTITHNRNGERFCFEAIETPFHSEESLDKIATVGTLLDISELDEIKRNLKQYQNAHLEILGALGTAFAVFDHHFKLSFYNRAFKNLWQIEDDWFEKACSYGNFLDNLRQRHLLPEVPDYPFFKSEEQKVFGTIIEPKEDLLHLPDGRSLRRVRAPYLNGGLVFAFEDITDRLTASREYNSLINVRQEILNNIEEAVLIFGGDGRLKIYNQAYVKMWNANPTELDIEPTFNELLDTQKQFFVKTDNWEPLKKDIILHVFSDNTSTFCLKRSVNDVIECSSTLLSNESIMVLMRKIPNV